VRRIPPTGQQSDLHDAQRRIIQGIIRKRFISEMDMLRLKKALLLCRLSANSTFLVNREHPGHSSKLKELETLLETLLAEKDRKVILFSEWTGMLDLIEPILDRFEADYVRLDGSVPQKRRQGLVSQFQNDPACSVFMTTNAGATGLNLQAANTVINVDLPWNPAVLEQRIARAHRMGQKRPVQVFLLVTENTIEENLLATLAAKKDLSLAVLDPGARTTEVTMASGVEELKKRLEVLLGSRPEAAVDEVALGQARSEALAHANRERISMAGGQLLAAAFSFIGSLYPDPGSSTGTDALARQIMEGLSTGMERDSEGRLALKVVLPDEAALLSLSRSLSRVVAAGLQVKQGMTPLP